MLIYRYDLTYVLEQFDILKGGILLAPRLLNNMNSMNINSINCANNTYNNNDRNSTSKGNSKTPVIAAPSRSAEAARGRSVRTCRSVVSATSSVPIVSSSVPGVCRPYLAYVIRT